MMETIANKNKISSFLLDSKYHIHRHVLLQVIILIITIGNFFDAPDTLNLSLNRFYSWLCYFLYLNVLVYFNAYVLFPRYLAKDKILMYAVSVSVFLVIMIFIMIIIQDYFYDIAVIHQEPSAMALFFSIASSLLSMLLFIGGISTLLLFRQWMISNQRIISLKTATSRSELEFLKSQINPHFLFNMLNNANILVEEEPEMASYILTKLDELLTYQLNDSVQDKVSLKADIRFLSNYLELEKTRRDKFEYRITKEGDMDNIQVAPLLFIPFVENAVKHNNNANGGKDAYIHISFSLQGDELTFVCRNPVSKKVTPAKDKGGLGLTNIKRRLDLLFEKNYFLEQTKTDEIYTVRLQIKLDIIKG